MEPSENNPNRQKSTPNPGYSQNTPENPTAGDSKSILFNESTSAVDPCSSSNFTHGSNPVLETPIVLGMSSDSQSQMFLEDLDTECWDSAKEDDDFNFSNNNISQLTPSEILNTIIPPFPPSESEDSSHFILPNCIFSDIPSTSQIPHSSFPIRNDSFIDPVIERGDLSPSHSQVEQLIRAAKFVEADNIMEANMILQQLNQELSLAAGNPLQRAVFYFKEALESLLCGTIGSYLDALSSIDAIHKIDAYKDFYEILPISKFTNFTANQAIIEAVDGFTLVHVIDFDIGIGDQWMSFMLDISKRCRAAMSQLPLVRITAIVEKESLETDLALQNLRNLARDLGLQIQVEFLSVYIFATLAFGAIWIADGEATVVNFSQSIFRKLEGEGMAEVESVYGFLRYLRQISPRIIVFVDMECRCGYNHAIGTSFHQNIVAGLKYYSSLMESLDTVASDATTEKTQGIERFLLQPRIFQCVMEALKRPFKWRELISNAGMLPIPFSEFTHRDVECLVRRSPVQGFQVAQQHGSMMLMWQEREIASTSAWSLS
ncbi:scarecrow-like protein 15 [Tasmannia lanceolata]|uniref:scarecrow-like protein 15 n=1 Tax=Tasmannia lanceolata TaxID=3420 RepID=UPI00406389E7